MPGIFVAELDEAAAFHFVEHIAHVADPLAHLVAASEFTEAHATPRFLGWSWPGLAQRALILALRGLRTRNWPYGLGSRANARGHGLIVPHFAFAWAKSMTGRAGVLRCAFDFRAG
jgi:hypothetical protein